MFKAHDHLRAAPRITGWPARALQLLLAAVAVTLFVWALADPIFRDAEGFLTGRCCLLLSAGVAALVAGWTMTAVRWRRAAFWFGLALVGQAAALQLIDAGPFMRYQHYRPLPQLLTDSPLPLALLAAQILFVAAGLWSRRAAILGWLRRAFHPWQLALIAVAGFLFSATVSPEIPRYAAELAFAAFVQAMNLGAVVLLAWAIPEDALPGLRRRFDRLLNGRSSGRLDRVALGAAVWVIVLSALFSIFSYQRHPHIPDEVVYLYHARFLAAGELTMPAPPVEEAFDIYLMQFQGDEWYPSPPPGWPLMLAVGVLFGAPWLVNPALAGLNILLAFGLVERLYGRRAGRMVVLLLAVSPWYVFMGMNFMTHQFTLTCALLATLMVMRARERGQARWAWLGGLALGMMSLIRPLEAAIIAGLLGLWAIGLGGKRLKWTAVAGLVLSSMAVGALVLPYNAALTGDPRLFPIMAYTDERFAPNANALGFGPDRGMGWPIDPNPGHSPVDALINADLNTFSIHIELFGWSIGSLLFVAVAVFAGRRRREDWLMLAVIGGIFAAHFFYYFSGGPDFGARYWFLMIVPLVALTVRGIDAVSDRLSPMARTRLLVAVVALGLMALVNIFPWRAIDKYHHYLNMRPDIRHLAQEQDFGGGLVLVEGDGHPDYASAAAYNPLDFSGDDPIYAWDRNGAVRANLLAAYPERPIWLVAGPTITGVGYEVVAGPLTKAELEATSR